MRDTFLSLWLGSYAFINQVEASQTHRCKRILTEETTHGLESFFPDVCQKTWETNCIAAEKFSELGSGVPLLRGVLAGEGHRLNVAEGTSR